MSELVIVMGDFELSDLFLNKVFTNVMGTTPLFLKNGLESLENLVWISRATYTFIRIDYPSLNGLHLTRLIRKKYPESKLIWVSKDSGYALAGFDEGVDAFLELPVTEEGLEQVMFRLKRLSKTDDLGQQHQ